MEDLIQRYIPTKWCEDARKLVMCLAENHALRDPDEPFMICREGLAKKLGIKDWTMRKLIPLLMRAGFVDRLEHEGPTHRPLYDGKGRPVIGRNGRPVVHKVAYVYRFQFTFRQMFQRAIGWLKARKSSPPKNRVGLSSTVKDKAPSNNLSGNNHSLSFGGNRRSPLTEPDVPENEKGMSERLAEALRGFRGRL
ncbi:hypothetical protein JH26_24165 [Microvirga sp. BSC39]|nr:hypothetical protein JH26_24165 [Microvirga sp. BSC39]